ncbi:MAG: dihydroxy-acid dehydratase, partial [Candidatus Bathyarchaeia archaeon]
TEIANMCPGCLHAMEDLYKIGRVPLVMKNILAIGFIDGILLTVTGKTIKENFDAITIKQQHNSIIASVAKPLS